MSTDTPVLLRTICFRQTARIGHVNADKKFVVTLDRIAEVFKVSNKTEDCRRFLGY